VTDITGKNVNRDILIQRLIRIVGEKHVFTGIVDLIIHVYNASAPPENQMPISSGRFPFGTRRVQPIDEVR
jgi:hypothetical protein